MMVKDQLHLIEL
ncbi:unnamed protein product [Cuscuta epithymum]|uniref:Uncharacterized protein n=1 Tax=Cuscuta epithymum TaxID=186058 RepID=A0AAV0C280_9ASTE|nr:unnamed protein product [Cuscuta epithymum]